MKKVFWVLLACIPWLWGCVRNSELPEDFEVFYAAFHADSVYQVEHIPFPIEGVPSFSDTLAAADPGFRWTMDNWQLHRSFSFDESEYTRTFTTIGEDIVVEQVVHQSGSFAMMRRFARMGDRWYLIYFADMNPVKRKQGVQIEGGFTE